MWVWVCVMIDLNACGRVVSDILNVCGCVVIDLNVCGCVLMRLGVL